MPFTPKDWRDAPDVTTPITAAALEDIEIRLAAYTDTRATALTTAAPFNVKSTYGAQGDGITDDTTALQNAINDAQTAAGVVFLPAGTYKITSALAITTSVTIMGVGVEGLWGSQVTSYESFALPITSPFLAGSVIRQDTAATDAIQITGTGVGVNFVDLGIKFADAIRFTNTGHGIYSQAAAYSTGRDNGLTGFRWDNVMIWGHDGNHYGAKLVNSIYGTFGHLQTFGGGGVMLANDSPGGGRNYGNHTFVNPYLFTCAAGSAHVLTLSSPALNSGSATNGTLQIIVMVRPQLWLRNIGTAVSGVTQPTSAQKLISKDSGVKTVTMVQPDIESNIASATFDTDVSQMQFIGGHYITPGLVTSLPLFSTKGGSGFPAEGLAISHDDAATTSDFVKIQKTNGGGSPSWKISLASTDFSLYNPGFIAQDQGTSGITPTAAAGANAGTTPPAPVVGTNSRAMRGEITFGTGTTPAAGAMVTVTHGQAQPFNNVHPVVTPINAATANLGLYISAYSKTAFTISAANAPAASQANTIYGFVYHCIA